MTYEQIQSQDFLLRSLYYTCRIRKQECVKTFQYSISVNKFIKVNLLFSSVKLITAFLKQQETIKISMTSINM